ncbi:methyltransferase domain-containing protein [Nocardioides speluncae]|uniref:methyltransferase domain-containing protein n=1 Tax=Nocardioides speluncae TaxID=2670337 RepID=UPI00197F1571|nr:methyltransferase domain-containing protein [Nocardioides speluncae]
MTPQHMDDGLSAEAASARVRLVQGLADAGALTDPAWRSAFVHVPRDAFVPYFYDHAGSLISRDDPETAAEWFTAVHENRALVTHRTNGAATSSTSQPSVMAVMLEALAAEDGMTVLEIGTGTGYNAALLAHRLGDVHVVTIDLTTDITAAARDRLAATGRSPLVVTGDGAAGYPERAPYDRIIATCRLRTIPPALTEQLTDSGLIVTPLGNALARIHRTGLATAEGRFLPDGAFFMPLRHPGEASLPSRPQLPTKPGRPSTLPATALADNSFRFLASIVEPDLTWQYDLGDDQQISGARVWSTDGSIAHLHTDTSVSETGPRPLWRNLEDAHTFYQEAGEPSPDRYGVTIEGQMQRVWFNDPDGPSWTLHP